MHGLPSIYIAIDVAGFLLVLTFFDCGGPTGSHLTTPILCLQCLVMLKDSSLIPRLRRLAIIKGRS